MSAYHQSKADDSATLWMSDDNPCKTVGPDFMFPSDGGIGLQAAINVCLQCDNRLLCLDYALRNRIDHGVWGGQSERGRKRILKAARHFPAA